MCLFSIYFKGRRYNKAAALRLLESLSQEIEKLTDKVKWLEKEAMRESTKFTDERNRHRQTQCELGEARRQVRELKAQLSTANEELNDFPARAKSGKYVKRRKTAKPEVKPTNAE